MNDNIMEEINENLSIDELGEVAKKALAMIYTKLRKEENFSYDMKCFVASVGYDDYDISLIFIDEPSDGESWAHTYKL